MTEELTQTELTEPGRGARWIFIGNNGIRAGWSALIFIAIFVGLQFIVAVPIFTFLHLRVERGAPQPPHVALVQEAVQALLVLLATFIMSRIEKRSVAVYGYAGRARLVRFVSGGASGFLAISLLIGALWKSHLLVFDGSPLQGVLAWKFAAEWAAVFILVGVFEESLLRGYLQYTLARGTGFWWAALILSVAFALWHMNNGGESLL